MMPNSPSAPPVDEEFYAQSPLEMPHEFPKDTLAAEEIIVCPAANEESDGYYSTQGNYNVAERTPTTENNVEIEEGIRNIPSEVTWFLKAAANEGIDLKRSYKRSLYCKSSAVVTLYLGSSSSGNKVFVFCSANLRDAGFVYAKSFTSFFLHDIESAVPVVCFSRIAQMKQWRTPQSQKGLDENVYARSFVLSCRVYGTIDHGNMRFARVMLTAPDVETCYRICTALNMCAHNPLLLHHLARQPCLPSPTLSNCLFHPISSEGLMLEMTNHATNVLKIGMRVELNYHADIQIRATDSFGRRGSVVTPVLDPHGNLLFGDGMFVLAVIASMNAETGLFTLQYEDGPFHISFIPSITKPRTLRLFGSVACEFVDVDREHIRVSNLKPVELAESVRLSKPYFMIGISLLQVGVFTWYLLSTETFPQSAKPTIGSPMLWFKLVGRPSSEYDSNSDFPRCDDLRPQVWRFLSYQFVHNGFVHISTNVVIQLMLGCPLESIHGFFRVGFVYTAGIYGGAILCAMTDVYSNVVGASGGIYSIMGMHVANLLMNWSEMNRSYWNHWVVLFMLILCFSIEIYESMSNQLGEVSNAAHYGGFVSGLFLGLLMLRNTILKFWERYILLPIAFICAITFLFGGSMWVFTHWPPEHLYYLDEYRPPPCCWIAARCPELKIEEYALFNCRVSSGRNVLKADGREFSTCSDVLNFTASL